MNLIGLFVVAVISNCTGVIFGIASIYSADKDVKEIRDNIKNIRKKVCINQYTLLKNYYPIVLDMLNI